MIGQVQALVENDRGNAANTSDVSRNVALNYLNRFNQTETLPAFQALILRNDELLKEAPEETTGSAGPGARFRRD